MKIRKPQIHADGRRYSSSCKEFHIHLLGDDENYNNIMFNPLYIREHPRVSAAKRRLKNSAK